MNIPINEPQLPCQRCGSALTVKLSRQLHCNSCGEDMPERFQSCRVEKSDGGKP
jgi:predicted RNA-binding Zn-ribbon protein involved in translation (DUF1610 family)